MRREDTPFPLEGGRVGDGGVASALRNETQKGSAPLRPALKRSGSTPSQPSPLEGEGYSRFDRQRRVASKQVARARTMRAEPTRAEARLWERLRTLSVRFRRQALIGLYVVDFACHRARLVIEVDGGVHDQTEVALNDLRRDGFLKSQGYDVLRIANRDVENNVEGVIDRIRNLASNRIGKAL